MRGLLVDFVGLAHSGECCLDFKVDVGMALVNVHTDLEILNESDQHRSVHVVYIHLVREHLGERLQRGQQLVFAIAHEQLAIRLIPIREEFHHVQVSILVHPLGLAGEHFSLSRAKLFDKVLETQIAD